MTLSPWIIYLWGIADNVRETSIAISILLGIGFFVTCLIRLVADEILSDSNKATLMTILRKLPRAFIPMIALATFVPTSKTIAVMVIAPAIVNSTAVQKDLPDLYKIAVDALKDSFAGKDNK